VELGLTPPRELSPCRGEEAALWVAFAAQGSLRATYTDSSVK